MRVSRHTSASLRLITAKKNYTPIFWISNSEMIIIEKILSENVDLQVTAGPLKSFWERRRWVKKKYTNMHKIMVTFLN